MRKLTFVALLVLFGVVSLELLDVAAAPGAEKAEIHKMDGPGEHPPSPAP